MRRALRGERGVVGRGDGTPGETGPVRYPLNSGGDPSLEAAALRVCGARPGRAIRPGAALGVGVADVLARESGGLVVVACLVRAGAPMGDVVVLCAERSEQGIRSGARRCEARRCEAGRRSETVSRGERGGRDTHQRGILLYSRSL